MAEICMVSKILNNDNMDDFFGAHYIGTQAILEIRKFLFRISYIQRLHVRFLRKYD